MSRPISPAALWLLLVGCTSHSEPFSSASGSFEEEVPLLRGGTQLTFNPGQDYSPSWTADGKGILYVYSEAGNRRGSRCIGLLPPASGRRLFSFCDDRATHADSMDAFGATGLLPDGTLVFFQVTGKPPSTYPFHFGLWIADTGDVHGTRRLMASLPRRIGDSVISWLSTLDWVGPRRFVAVGQGLEVRGRRGSPIQDTIFLPRSLILGDLDDRVTPLRAIPGTEFASQWGRAGNGDLLFVRSSPHASGELTPESIVRRVPLAGGTSVVVASLPQGRAVSELSCRDDRCLVGAPGGAVYWMDATSGALQALPVSGANRTGLMLHPDGRSILYQANGNIWREALPP